MNMNMKKMLLLKYLAVGFVCVTAIAVNPASAASLLPPAGPIVRDLVYGTDSDQRVDFYRPAQPADLLIVVIHGGAITHHLQPHSFRRHRGAEDAEIFSTMRRIP